MDEGRSGARTGVFLCTCNGTIDITLDTKALEGMAKDMDGVVMARRSPFLCHKKGREELARAIKEERLDRVMIAACSPLLYLREFEEAAHKGGLMPSMVEMANIREQCAWIHSGDRAAATQKAADVMAMAAAKLQLARPNNEGTKVWVRSENCSGCGVCQATCRVNAIKIVDIPERPGHRLAVIDPVVCEGCGACVAACPSAALDQARFSNAEMGAEIDAITPPVSTDEERFPNVVVFACHWCSYAAADQAGIKRLQLPANFHVVRTMCSARVDPEWVMRALSRGADGVLILAGKPGRCHYEVGSIRTNRRMALLNAVIKQLGFDEDRFQTMFVDSDEPERFQRNIEQFIRTIKRIGPSPMRTPEPEEPQAVALQFGTVSEAQLRARGLL